MWVAVNTHPNREQLAIDNLKRQGYEAYCPVFSKKVSHARTIKEVRKPLFPGYLFINIDEARQGCRAISSTFGVRHLVSFGGNPARLPEKFIEELKGSEVNGCIPSRPLEETLPAGAKVLIKSGIFKDLVGCVLNCRPQDRVIVMLDFLKRSVKAEVSAEYLERA